jgi:hypothetical protein
LVAVSVSVLCADGAGRLWWEYDGDEYVKQYQYGIQWLVVEEETEVEEKGVEWSVLVPQRAMLCRRVLRKAWVPH